MPTKTTYREAIKEADRAVSQQLGHLFDRLEITPNDEGDAVTLALEFSSLRARPKWALRDLVERLRQLAEEIDIAAS